MTLDANLYYCAANKLTGTFSQCSTAVKNTISCLLHAIYASLPQKNSFCLWVLLSSLSEAWNNKLRYLTCSASFTHLPLGETAGVAGCLYCLGGSCTDYLITIENNFVISSITTTNIPKTKKTFDAGTKHPYIIENSICDSQTYFPQYISLWLWPVYWVISDLSEPGLIQHHERL